MGITVASWRRMLRTAFAVVIVPLLLIVFWVGCNDPSSGISGNSARADCQFVSSGYGPTGTVAVQADKVITGLEVPWAIAFLPNGDWLVTERPGRLRLVQNGTLVSTPVATIDVVSGGEQGLLGLALDPQFATNSRIYVYNTVSENGQNVNRVDRYILAGDHKSVTFDRTIVDGIPAGNVHNGGRIRFGKDGDLYIGTGETENGPLAQDPNSLGGKILRVTADGAPANGNPNPASAVFVSGVRNVQALDFLDAGVLIVAEHGPTGEINGWTGHDRVEFAAAGDNFGWPITYGCGNSSYATPAISWQEAVPPGGGSIYTGGAIPEWTGSFITGTLESEHLHRFVFTTSPYGVTTHEVYLQGQFGRLRDVENGPDGYLYVTTSNCDGRGNCPSDQDYILRIRK